MDDFALQVQQKIKGDKAMKKAFLTMMKYATEKDLYQCLAWAADLLQSLTGHEKLPAEILSHFDEGF